MFKKIKKISIIGSTGSIGSQGLEVVRNNPEMKVETLAAKSNIKELEKQIREFKPKKVCVFEEDKALELKHKVKDLDVGILYGMDGLIECACDNDSEYLLSAVVGMIGILPTLWAIKSQKKIALANKETLVCAGHIIMPLAKEKNVPILPVDSEHSAIFQSLNGERENKIKKIILTCSGGPFRGYSLKDLEKVTVGDALKHPNWNMGKKITVDSATLVNKGLEVMEASWLFDTCYKDIEVMIHPESVIHSAVQFEDNAVIAQMGVPDMKLPIQYALTYPKRLPMKENELDLFELGSLTFEKPDIKVFKGLGLAFYAMEKGGNVPAVYNAANEIAVGKFLDGKIGFLDIPDMIEKCIEKMPFIANPSVDDILGVMEEAKEYIGK